MQLFLYGILKFYLQNFESMFNNVLGQDGIIYDDVSLWSEFNKCGDSIDYVDIGFGDIVEVMGTNNQVAQSHGAPIGFYMILVDGGRIL